MSTVSISSPFPIFTDIDGQPLENGYIFIGIANLGPIGNPINVYWDAALTIPAAQPIRTLGGYPINNGTPARLYVSSQYSIQVQNRNGSVVYSAPVDTEFMSSANISYLPAGTGAVATTVQTVLRRTISVDSFPGVDPTGATDSTAGIRLAVASLTSGQTLEFTSWGNYVISYIWTPYTDTDATLPGYGQCVGYVNGLSNVTIDGKGATITVVNHNITTNGGLRFIDFHKSPNCTIKNFVSNMSFTGYNNSASYYPICGFTMAWDLNSGIGVQSALCSNFTATGIRFTHYHPLGAFGITANPYFGDVNNGFKIISIFASGDGSATNYANQNRKLTIKDIHFTAGHNGYGCWGIAYNLASFQNVMADAWIAASYTIASSTYTGTNFVSPVRFYQYYCRGLTVDNVQVISLPAASRTGAFSGVCGGVSIESGLTTQFSGGGSVTNCKFTLDSPSTGLGSVNDTGIECNLGGEVEIGNNAFESWSVAGVVCIKAGAGGSGTGAVTLTISGNSVGRNVRGPFVQLITGNNTSDATRLIKSVIIIGNNVYGWGAEGAVSTYIIGTTYYGVQNIVVSNNVFDGTNSAGALTGTAVNCQGRTSGDLLTCTNNVIRYSGSPLQHGSATVIATDNQYTNNVSAGSAINYLTNFYPQLTTFTGGQIVSVPITGNDYASYSYNEYTAAAAWSTDLVGVANSGTGGIYTVGAGGYGRLTWKKIGNIK